MANRPTENRQWLSPSAALKRFQPIQQQLDAAPGLDLYMPERYGFRLGQYGFLLDSRVLSEVFDPLPVYRLPNTPEGLLGLINLRGNLVPVYDLALLLDFSHGTNLKQMMLVLGAGEDAVCVMIDELPATPDLLHQLPRVPPLPTILRDHIGNAFIAADVVWLEFEYRSFFQAVIAQAA